MVYSSIILRKKELNADNTNKLTIKKLAWKQSNRKVNKHNVNTINKKALKIQFQCMFILKNITLTLNVSLIRCSFTSTQKKGPQKISFLISVGQSPARD